MTNQISRTSQGREPQPQDESYGGQWDWHTIKAIGNFILSTPLFFVLLCLVLFLFK